MSAALAAAAWAESRVDEEWRLINERCSDYTQCGADDVTRLAIDHRIPVDLGGSNDPSNLRTLCKACNSSKGARL